MIYQLNCYLWVNHFLCVFCNKAGASNVGLRSSSCCSHEAQVLPSAPCLGTGECRRQVFSGLTGNHLLVPMNHFKMLCQQAAAELTGETGESHFQTVDEENGNYSRNVNQPPPHPSDVNNENANVEWSCVCRNRRRRRPWLGHSQH